MGTRAVRRSKGRRIPTGGNQCLYGAAREPKQILGKTSGSLAAVSRALADASRELRVLRRALDPEQAAALAEEVERVMEEGEGIPQNANKWT